jgi:hypothetical protein
MDVNGQLHAPAALYPSSKQKPQNHENMKGRNTGQGGARHRKYKLACWYVFLKVNLLLELKATKADGRES